MKSVKMDSDFAWGQWAQFKETYCNLIPNVKNYHGDIFITYNQIEKAINESVKNNSEICFIVSLHDCGGDFVNLLQKDSDFIELMIDRINDHEGSFIFAIRVNDELQYMVANNNIVKQVAQKHMANNI